MYTREWENKCLWKDRIRHTTFITSEYPQWLSLASIVSIYVVFLKIDVRLNIIVTKSLTNNITIEQVSSIASLNLILNTYIYLGMGCVLFIKIPLITQYAVIRKSIHFCQIMFCYTIRYCRVSHESLSPPPLSITGQGHLLTPIGGFCVL